jgi:hypothetical protein
MRWSNFNPAERAFIVVFYGTVALGIYAHLFLTVYERTTGGF